MENAAFAPRGAFQVASTLKYRRLDAKEPAPPFDDARSKTLIPKR
jgi:hypothetical protein